jgi:hypothetical protein
MVETTTADEAGFDSKRGSNRRAKGSAANGMREISGNNH